MWRLLMIINLNGDLTGTLKDTIKMNETRQLKLDEMRRNLNMTDAEREEIEYEKYKKELFADINFWSTEKLELYNKMLDSGELDLLKNTKSPFYDNNPGVRKSGVDFGYTEEELEETKRCKDDVIYFAENYCYTMTAHGYKQIKLRPYQKRVLKELYENNFSVFLASRQIGKCFNFDTKIVVNGQERYFFELFYEQVKKNRKLNILEKLKYSLYILYVKI